MATSIALAVRLGSVAWCSSSRNAQPTATRKASQAARRVDSPRSRVRATNHRAASTAYSVTCADFRTRAWTASIWGVVMPGSSQRSRGFSTRPVCSALKAPVENHMLAAIQASGGSQKASRCATLCYNLPVLQALVRQPDARALYVFPTKALAQDQLAELEQLAKQLPEMRMFTYDGDTPQDSRRAVRARANLVLTNPDMLHSGILPHHTKWAVLFQNLKYVVVDELHAYRGVFGSHLSNVLRRLHRICAHYGSTPQFIMASATIANPGELAARLTGEDVDELAESGAPSGDKTFLCYNPPVVNPELGIRAPYLGETAKLAIRLLRGKIATISFAQSRLSTEVLLTAIKSGVADRATGDSGLVRGYRGGYLPNPRREGEPAPPAGDGLGGGSPNAP